MNYSDTEKVVDPTAEGEVGAGQKWICWIPDLGFGSRFFPSK